MRRFDHAFVIPAYGESLHIEACIASLAGQRGSPTRVVIATSTPSAFLEVIAARHRLPLAVNPVREGIGGDWNFALTTAAADWVTIAHQDDLYRHDYLDAMSAAIASYPDALIAFSDYDEIDPEGPRPDHLNLRVKRRLCRRAFGDRDAVRSPADKRRLLAWGNPVCCPSVVIHRSAIPDFRFGVALKSNLDWEGWLNLADREGDFVYVRKPLVTRRIHPASETTALIADERRLAEDRIMFRRMWPAPVAALILAVYRAGYLANRT